MLLTFYFITSHFYPVTEVIGLFIGIMMSQDNGTKAISKLDKTDNPLECQHYFRISKAAEILSAIYENISADKLLIMGTEGEAEIMAPVVSEGIFEWPMWNAIPFYPEIDKPIRRNFNSSDRVILLADDLIKIVGVGWAIPNAFFDPSTAQKAIEYFEFCMPDPPWENCELSLQNDTNTAKKLIKLLQSRLSESSEPDLVVATITTSKGNGQEVESLTLREGTKRAIKYIRGGGPKHFDSDEIKETRELSFHTPWRAVKTFDVASERTTIDHLFISAKELERLKAVLENKKQGEELSSKSAVTLTQDPTTAQTAQAVEALLPITNWKMRIQAEATIRWLNYLQQGCKPSVNNMKEELAKWCVENKVESSPGINPSAGYIARHVIGSKTGWKAPLRPKKRSSAN